ncbi:MAG: acyl carrier protein [Myxococcota bacterium]
MTREDIFAIVRSNTQEVLVDIDAGEIRLDRQLKELGANSIDRMEIVTMSMEDAGVKIPLVDLAGISNIGELVALLHNHAGGATGG